MKSSAILRTTLAKIGIWSVCVCELVCCGVRWWVRLCVYTCIYIHIYREREREREEEKEYMPSNVIHIRLVKYLVLHIFRGMVQVSAFVAFADVS